jgi:hypothetical protein
MCRVLSVLLIFVALAGVPAFSQNSSSTASPQSTELGTFPDSPEGLRLLLSHVLATAKSRDAEAQLPGLIKDMEVPNYRNWATATFGKKRGGSWAKSYEKDLASEEKLLAGRFVFWAGEDGDFFVWKVGKDSNSPGGYDKYYVQDAVQPLDRFYAEWRRSSYSSKEDADSVGYFLFIDGKFRLDKTFQPIPLHGVNAGGQPSCSYCPPPEFPPSQLKKGGFAEVVLSLIVEPGAS